VSGIFRFLALLLVGKALMARRRAAKGETTARATPGGASMTSSTQYSTATHAPSPSQAREEGRPIPPQGADAPGPDTPLDLEAPDWKATLKRTVKEIKEDRVTLVAAGMAYYFFLALVPAFIALVGIMGLARLDAQPLIESITGTLPGDSGTVLAQPLEQAQRTSAGASLTSAIVGIAVALWSASAGMVALQAGLNVAYDVPQDRKFLGKRAVALLLIVATGVLGGVPSPIFTFGESTIFVVLGWILTVVAVVLLFSIFYYLGPNRDSPRWQWITTGGVIGALLWILAAVGFGLYVEGLGGAGNYSETYGALAGVVVLILLLFLSSLAVLIGGELNAELERQAAQKP
jgi:membrane protein